MIGIKEILNKLILNQPLTEKEKFQILKNKIVDKEVIEYLLKKLSDLHIEILGDYEGNLFELMSVGKLEGWC